MGRYQVMGVRRCISCAGTGRHSGMVIQLNVIYVMVQVKKVIVNIKHAIGVTVEVVNNLFIHRFIYSK